MYVIGNMTMMQGNLNERAIYIRDFFSAFKYCTQSTSIIFALQRPNRAIRCGELFVAKLNLGVGCWTICRYSAIIIRVTV